MVERPEPVRDLDWDHKLALAFTDGVAEIYEELLTRLSDLQLATDAELPRRRGNFVLGFDHVPVRFTPAHRSR